MVTKERHPRLLRQGQDQDPVQFTSAKEKEKAEALREIGTAEADRIEQNRRSAGKERRYCDGRGF